MCWWQCKDYVVVVEGPQNDERATAVSAEVKRTVPNKPIKCVVNSSHHFDHTGGFGAFVADGATVITHAIGKPFFEQAFAAPRLRQVQFSAVPFSAVPWDCWGRMDLSGEEAVLRLGLCRLCC